MRRILLEFIRRLTPEQRRRIRRNWPWLLLLPLAVMSAIWLGGFGDPTEAPTAVAHTPSFYVENFVATTMGSNGRHRRRVEAAYMAHFADTDTHELESPYLVLYRERGQPWHVRSEQGWLSGEGDVLLLLGQVRIWRNNADGERLVAIETQDLRVLPESEYGETDQPIRIITPHSQTQGVGMRAYMDTSRVELLSQVKTVYDPNTFIPGDAFDETEAPSVN